MRRISARLPPPLIVLVLAFSGCDEGPSLEAAIDAGVVDGGVVFDSANQDEGGGPLGAVGTAHAPNGMAVRVPVVADGYAPQTPPIEAAGLGPRRNDAGPDTWTPLPPPPPPPSASDPDPAEVADACATCADGCSTGASSDDDSADGCAPADDGSTDGTDGCAPADDGNSDETSACAPADGTDAGGAPDGCAPPADDGGEACANASEADASAGSCQVSRRRRSRSSTREAWLLAPILFLVTRRPS